MDLNQFCQSITDDCFTSSATFQKDVVYSRLDLQELGDSPTLRALCVLMHYGMVDVPDKCETCGAKCSLVQTARYPDELMWLCNENRSKSHFKKTLSVPAIEVRNNKLLPFLHCLVFMMCNERVGRIQEELDAARGCKRNSIFNWQKLYHQAISKLVSKKGLNKIGGEKERCAIDETAIGKVGRMVGKPPQKAGTFARGADRIKARRPCKTLWKPKAKPFPTRKAGSSRDKRANKATQWIWLGVQCGKGGQQPRSHAAGSKRVAMSVLPDAPSAPAKKPRGAESLTQVLKARLRSKTKLSADGWKGTEKAAANLKLPVKVVNHNKTFRAADGTHTNDVESEIAKFKLWPRGKWAKVRTLNSHCSEKKQTALKSHLDEYVAQTNLGTGMRLRMSQVMYAFRLLDTAKKYPHVDLCS